MGIVDDAIDASDALINSQQRKSGTQDEDIQGSPQPVDQDFGGRPSEGDDGDNTNDSGDDVDESSVGDAYIDGKVSVPLSAFAQYASHTAREAAAAFQPKQFGTPGNLHPSQFGERLTSATAGGDANEHFAETSDAIQDGDKLRIVGGNSAVLDGNADRVLEAQIREMTHAGGDTSALQAQQAAVRAPFLAMKAPMPVTRQLDPLARVPTER